MKRQAKKYFCGISFLSAVFFVFFNAGNVSSANTQDYKQQAQEHYRQGQTLYESGKYKEAEKEFEKAKKIIEEGKIRESRQVPLPKVSKNIAGISEYIIGEGDVLLIKVWQNPDLDSEVMVRPDGMVSLALVEDVEAAGLSIKEFKASLTEKLTEYIKHPQVAVSIKKVGGRRIIVLGQVKNPGIYSVEGKRTVLEAIGLAGGFTNDAVSSSTILIKGGLNNPVAKRLNLTKALDKGDLRDNFVLDSEDIVFVPRKFISDLNYFLNQILEPVSRGLFTAREIRNW